MRTVLPYFALLLAVAALMLSAVPILVRHDAPVSRWTYPELLAVALLVMFAATRVSVGTDYAEYVRYWSLVRPDYWSRTIATSPQDSGFVRMQLVIKEFGFTHARALFWVTSVATIVPVIGVIKRQSLRPPMAVLLFMTMGSYLLPFNVVRQGLAASILFYAAANFLDHRRWLYVLLALLAASFHGTALPVAVVLYFARNWRPSARTAVLALGGGAAAAAVTVKLSSIAGLTTVINPRYDTYVVVNPSGIGTYLTIAAKVALLLLLYLGVRQISNRDQRYLTFASIGIATLIVGTQFVVLARLDIYFSFFLILALPNALESMGRRAPIVRGAVWVAATVYMAVFIANYAGLIGYKSSLFD